MQVQTSLQQLLESIADWLVIYGQLLIVGLVALLILWWLLRRMVRWFTPDPIHKEFRRVGIRPTRDQVESLRDAFATITSTGAQQDLQSRINNQSLMINDRAQLDRVKQLSQAHIEVVREVGAALRAIEAEYARSCKSLTSEQAKEALRLIVERSVAQITEMSHASANNLPEFSIHPPHSQNGHSVDTPPNPSEQSRII